MVELARNASDQLKEQEEQVTSELTNSGMLITVQMIVNWLHEVKKRKIELPEPLSPDASSNTSRYPRAQVNANLTKPKATNLILTRLFSSFGWYGRGNSKGE
jgi:hypothetical protein